jgi:hypothetical protein
MLQRHSEQGPLGRDSVSQINLLRANLFFHKSTRNLAHHAQIQLRGPSLLWAERRSHLGLRNLEEPSVANKTWSCTWLHNIWN